MIQPWIKLYIGDVNRQYYEKNKLKHKNLNNRILRCIAGSKHDNNKIGQVFEHTPMTIIIIVLING